tara:strand:+ start:26 stop:739 length:714 start_codon:yes stop_codon:yes gene_type:complete
LKRKFLAIIPARKGSKRLKNKNITPLNGKPLIAYTIESALNCSSIDNLVVSTDCLKIKEVSEAFGASVPFIRPQDLAQDESSTADVVMHVINFYENLDIYFENFILLQPTSPLRNSYHIISAINLMKERKANSIVSVCPCNKSSTSKWSGKLGKNNSMDNFFKDQRNISKEYNQDNAKLHRLNGAIYIHNIENFKQCRNFVSPTMSFAYEMDEEVSVDIDEYSDFLIAQKYLENKNA